MNFPGKINKFDSSRNYQFSSTIPHSKCTMYKAEQKDVKRKKNHLRESVVTHVACKQTLSAMTGFNRRKWEKKGEKES